MVLLREVESAPFIFQLPQAPPARRISSSEISFKTRHSNRRCGLGRPAQRRTGCVFASTRTGPVCLGEIPVRTYRAMTSGSLWWCDRGMKEMRQVTSREPVLRIIDQIIGLPTSCADTFLQSTCRRTLKRQSLPVQAPFRNRRAALDLRETECARASGDTS